MKKHRPPSKPEDTAPTEPANLGHGVGNSDETVRAVLDEVEHSDVLASEAQAVILKDGQIIDVDDVIPAGAAPGCDKSQPDSDRYGHPDHCPPNALDPLPPGACGHDATPSDDSDT